MHTADCSHTCEGAVCDFLWASGAPQGPSSQGLAARTCSTPPAREQGRWRAQQLGSTGTAPAMALGNIPGDRPRLRTLSCRSVPGCITIEAGAQASPSRTAPFVREGVRPCQDHFLHNNFPQGHQLGSFPVGPESRSVNTQMC